MSYKYTDYAKDVETYLKSKAPDLPEHVIMEIGDYIAHKTSVLVADVIWERDREWRRQLKKGEWQ